LGLAILIHACVIFALIWSGDTTARTGKETGIFLIPITASAVWSPPPQQPIRLEKPFAQTMIAPKIDIEQPGPGNEGEANGKRYDLRLPPRLDPQTPNVPPELPARLQGRYVAGNAYIVIVRALVLDTGRVGDAEIAASSGFSELDALALAQVREHWHFLPATLNGKAESDWVSVEVMIRPA
jgi:TonB family protein